MLYEIMLPINMPLDDEIEIKLKKVEDLRYGENPHQEAALYRSKDDPLQFCKQLHGKGMSATNVMDLDMNIQANLQLEDFGVYICTMTKHTSLSGAAADSSQIRAYSNAYASDKKSSFGCVMGFNTEVTPELAELLNMKEEGGYSFHFVEVIVAPHFDSEALEILKQNPNRRLIKFTGKKEFYKEHKIDLRTSAGFYLAQTPDTYVLDDKDCKVVAGDVDASERNCACFAYVAGKFVKSNSAVVASSTEGGYTTNAIGAGQQSRVDAFQVAKLKLEENRTNRRQFAERFTNYGFRAEPPYYVASTDSFMPFPDSLEVAGRMGVRTVICPEGGKNYEGIKKAAKELGLNLISSTDRAIR
jgi:phosphoribosylaminoimidazolecarboxamide formyltransferase/IMP cyclohydrolase